MAYIQCNVSKKTGEVINWKWTALLGRDKNGKQVRITKRELPYGLTPAKEKKEQQTGADEWEKKERAKYEKQHGTTAANRVKAQREKEQITLVSFIESNWLPKHVQDGTHTPNTIAFFNSMSKDITAYFNEHAPGLKLKEVDKETILDYLLWLRKEARSRRGKPYGAATIQHYYSTLRNILEYAVYIEYIEDDPCKKIKPGDRPKREQKEIDFLDEEQALRFLACLDSDDERAYWEKKHGGHLAWKCLVNTLILTGLRRGELVGLQWGDLDAKKMILHVRRNVTIDTTNKGETDPAKKVHIGETKGKSIRNVPISKYLFDLLTAYKAEQAKKYGTLFFPSAYIFCRADDLYMPIYPTEPTRLMRKFIQRHGLPDVSPHDLRHTAASLAIESGAGVKEIQSLLGHKDPSVTLKFYAALTERAQQRTIDGIENILRPLTKEGEKAQ